jgi:hypothetical protein
MAHDTVEATAARTAEVTGLFGQAFGIFGDSMKVAMKAQEETVRFWGEAFQKASPVQAVAGEFMVAAERNANEYLRLMEASYRRNADLLKKVMKHSNGNGDGTSLEKQTRDFWEASMETVRDNAQDLASTNMRVAQAWTEVLKKGANAQQKATLGKS